MQYLEDFNRMVGVAPSLLEATAADPMLAVLAKAFSVKVVKPADVKYLRYRKVGHGVELEDAASKFGGILTSVEPKDADPKALLAFLKKHGAKPAPKVESLSESTVRWKKQRPTEDYEEIWMAKTGMVDLIVKKVTPFDPDVERPYWVWIVTPAGAGEDDRRAVKNPHDIHNKAEAIRQAEREIPGMTRHMSMTGKWQRESAESLEEAITGVEKKIVDILLMGKQITGKANWYTVAQVAPNIPRVKEATIRKKLKSLEAKKIIELSGDRFRLIAKTRQKAPKARGRKPYKFMGGKNPFHESLEEAKSGFEIKIIHSKHNSEVVKVEVTGTFRGDEIHGKSDQIHLGLDNMRHGWVTLGKYLRINRPDSGKKVPEGFKTKILKAALAKLVPLAHKIGNKEFTESVEMTEKTKRDWYEDGRGMWRKEGTRFVAYVRDRGRYAEWNVSTATGAHYSVEGHAANVKAGMKAAEKGTRKLLQQMKDEREQTKRLRAQPRRSRPMKGAPWESIEEAVSKSDLLSGKTYREKVLINPGSKRVGLAMFRDGIDHSIQITKPSSWHEMAKHAPSFKEVGISFGWVYHRQGESLTKAGIRADVIKPYLTEIPKGVPPKMAVKKYGRVGYSVELRDEKGNLWGLYTSRRFPARFHRHGEGGYGTKVNEMPPRMLFEPTGKADLVDMP